MNIFLWVTLAILVLCVLMTALKLVKGPEMSDRLVAASVSTHIITFILAVAGVYGETDLLFDAALLTALVSFAATVVMAKYLTRNKVL